MVTLKTKMAISFLLAPCRSPLARTNALQLCASKKDIWLGKVQRSLGKKRFVNRPLDRTSAKSRRRIGRLRQFQRRARAARSRLESRGYAYGPKNQVAPRLPRLPGALVRCGAAHVRRTRQIEAGPQPGFLSPVCPCHVFATDAVRPLRRGTRCWFRYQLSPGRAFCSIPPSLARNELRGFLHDQFKLVFDGSNPITNTTVAGKKNVALPLTATNTCWASTNSKPSASNAA